jgi:hypothetical protein
VKEEIIGSKKVEASMTDCIAGGWKVQPIRQQQEWYWISSDTA